MTSIPCRTCLKMKLPSESSEVKKSFKILEMLNYLIPELNLSLVNDPVICTICIRQLKAAFMFKQRSLKNEQKLLKFAQNTNSQVDLQEFYEKTSGCIGGSTGNDHEELAKVEDNVNSYTVNNNCPNFDDEGCEGCLMVTKRPSMHRKVSLSPFICHNCGNHYDTIERLRKHLNNHAKLRRCEICSKPVRDLAQLRVHLRSHTGEKPFACSVCPKKFQQNYTLTQHLRQHFGNNTVKCQFCDKAFSTKYNAKIHMESFHKYSHKCALCGVAFSSKAKLTEHQQTELCTEDIKLEPNNEETPVIDGEYVESEVETKFVRIQEIILFTEDGQLEDQKPLISEHIFDQFQ